QRRARGRARTETVDRVVVDPGNARGLGDRGRNGEEGREEELADVHVSLRAMGARTIPGTQSGRRFLARARGRPQPGERESILRRSRLRRDRLQMAARILSATFCGTKPKNSATFFAGALAPNVVCPMQRSRRPVNRHQYSGRAISSANSGSLPSTD